MSLLPDPFHPAVVHFPIALSLVGLLLDLLSRHPKARSLAPGGLVLMVLAALGGIAAVLSGQVAEDDAAVPRAARDLLERHEELGDVAMWALLVVAAVRVVLALRGAFRGWAAWVYLALALAVCGLVGYQGYLGGELVFRHGVGTLPVQRGVAQGLKD